MCILNDIILTERCIFLFSEELASKVEHFLPFAAQEDPKVSEII